MIQVGLVGVGPQWERYRPALSRLRQPIHVEAVYDAVFARGESAAKELNADHIPGIRALAARGNVDAVLVMDPLWTNGAVLPLLARQEKPVFFAAWPLRNLNGGGDNSIVQQRDSGGLLVPAMWRRFTPTAIRLQELIATEIGPPLEITIDLSRYAPSTDSVDVIEKPVVGLEEIVGWLDFCRYLFRSFPVSAKLEQAVDPSTLRESACPLLELQLDYPQAGSAADSQVTRIPAQQPGHLHQRTARLLVRQDRNPEEQAAAPQLPGSFIQHLLESNGGACHSSSAATNVPQMFPDITIHCERGRAEITSETQIRWQTSQPAPEDETLTSERSKEEIMLDIFCRRVVGGLIPVADLSDILTPVHFLRSCFSQ